MTGLNHALTGALIGKFLPLPVALPLAVASHFVLDTLPHYGIPQRKRNTSHLWKYFFALDFLATFVLGIYALSRHHYAMLACGVVAVLPDFVWVARVVRTRSFNMSKGKNRYMKWHAGIQHYERPWGVYIEVPLAVVLFVFVHRYLNN